MVAISSEFSSKYMEILQFCALLSKNILLKKAEENLKTMFYMHTKQFPYNKS